MRHIRESTLIDRNAPELVDLVDHLRDTLLLRHGIAKARYLHLTPSIKGLSLKVCASSPLHAVAADFVENRRHALLHHLAERLRRPEPTRFAPGPAAAACIPEQDRDAWQACAMMIKTMIGHGWWHGFEVPTFGPGGRRRLLLINAPLEQTLTDSYIDEVCRDLRDFHLAFSAIDLAADPPPVLSSEERALLLGLAGGMRMEALAGGLGISTRGAEDRLKRIRSRLESRTGTQAVAKAVVMGLIP